MILQQPFHPIVGAAPFLISRESHDDVSIRLESLLLILNEIGDPNGGLRLIVTGAAAVVEAVLFDELKRIHAPVFALGFYDISVREKKNRLTGASAATPGYEVRFFWDCASDENIRLRKSSSSDARCSSFPHGRRRA